MHIDGTLTIHLKMKNEKDENAEVCLESMPMCEPFIPGCGLSYDFEPGIVPDGKMILTAIDSEFKNLFLSELNQSYNSEALPLISKIEAINSADDIDELDLKVEWYNEWDNENESTTSSLIKRNRSWSFV